VRKVEVLFNMGKPLVVLKRTRVKEGKKFGIYRAGGFERAGKNDSEHSCGVRVHKRCNKVWEKPGAGKLPGNKKKNMGTTRSFQS